MNREFDFGTGSALSGPFLNHLQDALTTFEDSITPTYNASQVLVQAAAEDEAQITIGGNYCVNTTDSVATVLGDPETYSIYAIASLAPSGINTFYLNVSTQAPLATNVKHIGTVDWTGSAITDVRQNPRTLNVAQVNGAYALYYPGPDVIPFIGTNGFIHGGFYVATDNREARLGDTIDLWLPPGAPIDIPETWALCNGQTLPSGSHDFGPFNYTLPSFTDKMTMGANPSAPWGYAGQPSNLVTAAPGIGGTKTTRTFSGTALGHTHTEPAHTHVATHGHTENAVHTHSLPSHTHPVDRTTFTFQTGSGTRRWNNILNTGTINDVYGPDDKEMTDYEDISQTTSSVQNTVSSARPTAMDARPMVVAFLKLMKVRH